ncbi:hypothetical protein ACPXCH_15400, partial [Streptomyces albogriseolus]
RARLAHGPAGPRPALRRVAVCAGRQAVVQRLRVRLARGAGGTRAGPGRLADFFDRGGRRPGPDPAVPAPAWRTALRDRVPR